MIRWKTRKKNCIKTKKNNKHVWAQFGYYIHQVKKDGWMGQTQVKIKNEKLSNMQSVPNLKLSLPLYPPCDTKEWSKLYVPLHDRTEGERETAMLCLEAAVQLISFHNYLNIQWLDLGSYTTP